eukprot:NODE_182_length_13754_cov_0.678067.p14 type:complete len:104 gc:universal NODE_182_length_13754_cov_0.678067:7217-7528(+)
MAVHQYSLLYVALFEMANWLIFQRLMRHFAYDCLQNLTLRNLYIVLVNWIYWCRMFGSNNLQILWQLRQSWTWFQKILEVSRSCEMGNFILRAPLVVIVARVI